MKLRNIDWKSSAILAAVLTGAVWLVSYVAGLFEQQVSQLFVAVPLTAAVTESLGTKVLGYVGGVIPLGTFGTMGIVALYISALATVILGTLIIGFGFPTVFKKGLFGFNGNVGRVFSTIIWGAIPVYALLVGFDLPGLMTVVAVVVHTLIVAFVATLLAGFLKLKI